MTKEETIIEALIEVNNRLLKERNIARRMLCEETITRTWYSFNTPQQVAKHHGWDCYEEKITHTDSFGAKYEWNYTKKDWDRVYG